MRLRVRYTADIDTACEVTCMSCGSGDGAARPKWLLVAVRGGKGGERSHVTKKIPQPVG